MNYHEIKPEDLNLNPFTKIGKEWMLITAGTIENFNTMTASWGSLGVFWGKNTITTYVRPQRYTKEFIDTNTFFSVSFFPEKYKDALSFCGSHSGRDVDKIKETGLTPYSVDNTVAFEEAELILVCKRLYHDCMPSEHFDEKENDAKWYPNKDYHIMYLAEITKILTTCQ